MKKLLSLVFHTLFFQHLLPSSSSSSRSFTTTTPETSARGCTSLLVLFLFLDLAPSISLSERFLWKASDERLPSMAAWLQRRRSGLKVLPELLTQSCSTQTRMCSVIVLRLCDIRETLALTAIYTQTWVFLPGSKNHQSCKQDFTAWIRASSSFWSTTLNSFRPKTRNKQSHDNFIQSL